VSRRGSVGQVRHASGFTLLEVLVSVSLLAMLLLVGYGAIRTATQSVKSGEALIARSEELRTAQTFLRRQLAGMMSLPYEIDATTGAAYRFDGERELIRFVAPMPGYLSRGGPHVQQLELVSDGDGLRLEFRHSQLNGFEEGDAVGGDREPVVLMAGIDDGRFEFRMREADGTIGDWTDQWDDPQLLPQQVRLQLEFDRDDQRHWPPLEIAVMASASPPGFNNIPGQPARPPRRPIQRPDQ